MKGIQSKNEEVDEKIEISKDDLMFMYHTFEKLNDFFHQPMNFETKEQLESFLGNKDAGAYHDISKCYYEILWDYLPENIKNEIINS